MTYQVRPTQATVERLLERVSCAAFAMDSQMRVFAWNRRAEKGLGLESSSTLGTQCYQALCAYDLESGLTCDAACPLRLGQGQPRMSYGRALRGRWNGSSDARLDCFVLKCILPEQQDELYIGVMGAPAASHVLEALGMVYPVIATPGPSESRVALETWLKAAVRAAHGDAADLLLASPGQPGLLSVACQTASPTAPHAACRSVAQAHFLELAARTCIPLAVVHDLPEGPAGQGPTWYLCMPLFAAGRVLGSLGLARQGSPFDLLATLRVLFPLTVQLSMYLQLARLEEGLPARANGSGAGAARLRFHCLGPFRVFLDGEPVPPERFQRQKSLGLLKFLVANRGKPVSRDALVELLWPEADPRYARKNLRVVLHSLRQTLQPPQGHGVLPPLVVSQNDMVYLDGSGHVWVDAEEFLLVAQRARDMAALGQVQEALAECRKAVQLYQGDYMEDEPYSDWCLFKREHLREAYISLLRRMAALQCEAGGVDDAISTYRVALGVDPAREDIHRELMRLLWQRGHKDEALRQYDICQRVLREELGIGLGQETQRLYRAILEG